ncbi:MAG TPA: HAD-IC family P-type ATPase [Saprospiraceae bacterium]|nr:HAD-IC family P-type ATPase [Saprospiraceae bacterium]
MSIIHQNRLNSPLAADIPVGLSHKEAIDLLATHGRNTISKTVAEPGWVLFVRQFKSPIVLLLVVASGMSFAFQEWLDGIAIIIVIVINAIIGFYMEYQAERSMEALKKLTSIPAKVLRDGKLMELNSEEIVPGDVIFLEAGDMTPADAIYLNGYQLQVDESALTGESVPVDKMPGSLSEGTPLAERTNALFKGTFVTKGNGWARVMSTGMQTELGKIAHLVQMASQAATPLERKLEEFSKHLMKITLGLVVIIFAVGWAGGQKIINMLETTIALAVAAIPEGLPIVATLALAQGMLKMAHYKVIVRRLSAVETLGGTTVICTDKTGTLTQNKMEVVMLNTPGGSWNILTDEAKSPNSTIAQDHYQMLQRIAILCNTAEIADENGELKEIGDPLETGLLKFALRQGEDVHSCRLECPKVEEIPFSSETKIMATMHNTPDGLMVFAKGAAEELLKCCVNILSRDGEIPLTPAFHMYWLHEAEQMAEFGLRVIAVAYKYERNDCDALTDRLAFIGLLGMIDPSREEVPAAIHECQQAGIQVIMVTGDHPATAKAIGKKLGLLKDDNDGVIIGSQMKDYEHLGEEDKDAWVAAKIFARTSPKQKLDLVKVLQERKAVVGMTGDGVNDAPALKKADIGIAMGQRGTQVAQEVADMVLKDDSFTSIVVAIREGRIIFDNIRKFVIYLLSCNLSELALIATVSILFLHFQLRPLQILFINLVTDVLPALALGLTAGRPGIMQNKPRSPHEPIIDRMRWRRIFFYATVITAATIGAVYFSHFIIHTGDAWDPQRCSNILFFSLIFAQLFHTLNMGSIDAPFFKTEVARNRYVWYSIGICLLIVFGLYQFEIVRSALSIVPMSATDWIVSIAAGLLAMVIIRIGKFLQFFRNDN